MKCFLFVHYLLRFLFLYNYCSKRVKLCVVLPASGIPVVAEMDVPVEDVHVPIEDVQIEVDVVVDVPVQPPRRRRGRPPGPSTAKKVRV